MGPQWIVEDMVNRTFFKTLASFLSHLRAKKQRPTANDEESPVQGQATQQPAKREPHHHA